MLESGVNARTVCTDNEQEARRQLENVVAKVVRTDVHRLESEDNILDKRDRGENFDWCGECEP